jgi:hypothetical protein
MADDIQSKAAEMMKKVLTIGVGTVFLTEDTLRTLAADFKLPKELLAGILDSASKTKDEFLGKLSKEVLDRVMEKVDPRSLVEEVLSKHEIDINIRLNFRPKNTKPEQSG